MKPDVTYFLWSCNISQPSAIKIKIKTNINISSNRAVCTYFLSNCVKTQVLFFSFTNDSIVFESRFRPIKYYRENYESLELFIAHSLSKLLQKKLLCEESVEFGLESLDCCSILSLVESC